jgi:hypothetical protein
MDSIFDCQICYKSYDHEKKKPLSYPCGHTFCYECTTEICKHNQIKCPFDKAIHQNTADTLPVNYAVLTALPMQASVKAEETKLPEGPVMSYCDVHKNKKVKFFCKNCNEMFCSKCVLKHTQQKHDVAPCSHQSKFEF